MQNVLWCQTPTVWSYLTVQTEWPQKNAGIKYDIYVVENPSQTPQRLLQSKHTQYYSHEHNFETAQCKKYLLKFAFMNRTSERLHKSYPV